MRRSPSGELDDLEKSIVADVLAYARAGDTEALASFLERAGAAFITDEVLRVIIDILRGRIRKKRGRGRLAGTVQREIRIATTAFLLEQCGMTATAANEQAAERHGSNRRSVERAKARHRGFRRSARGFLRLHLEGYFRLRDDEIRQLIEIWKRAT